MFNMSNLTIIDWKIINISSKWYFFWLSIVNFFRYTFKTKLSMKVYIFKISLNLIDFLPLTNKHCNYHHHYNANSIKTFVFELIKFILHFPSPALTLPLIYSVGSLPNTEKSLLLLSEWNDELTSIPKITTFLAKSSANLHKPVPS